MKSESEISKNLYMGIAIVFLVQFLWYHLTLPGSYLSLDKGKHPKPSVKTSLTSYLTYLLPMLVVLYFLNSKDNDCQALNMYVNAVCKK